MADEARYWWVPPDSASPRSWRRAESEGGTPAGRRAGTQRTGAAQRYRPAQGGENGGDVGGCVLADPMRVHEGVRGRGAWAERPRGRAQARLIGEQIEG
jgi:hypothetical protein